MTNIITTFKEEIADAADISKGLLSWVLETQFRNDPEKIGDALEIAKAIELEGIDFDIVKEIGTAILGEEWGLDESDIEGFYIWASSGASNLYGSWSPRVFLQLIEDEHPIHALTSALSSFWEVYEGKHYDEAEAAEAIWMKWNEGGDAHSALDASGLSSCIDWERYWDSTLRHEFHSIDGHYFRNI